MYIVTLRLKFQPVFPGLFAVEAIVWNSAFPGRPIMFQT